MKKISKIVIILITINVLIISSIISWNTVEASDHMTMTDIKIQEKAKEAQINKNKENNKLEYKTDDMIQFIDALQTDVNNITDDITKKTILQGYVDSLRETNQSAINSSQTTVKIDKTTINGLESEIQGTNIKLSIKGKEITNSSQANNLTTTNNKPTFFPKKLYPNDPNSPIQISQFPLEIVKPGDPMYNFYSNMISPKMTADQIKNKIKDLDDRIASNSDDTIKKKLEEEKGKWEKKLTEATLSSNGSVQISEELMNSTNNVVNQDKTSKNQQDDEEAEDENDGLGKPTILKLITGALDGIVGILFWLPKMLLLVTLYTAASVIGAILGGDFSIESIIFNQAIENPIGLISVNFFDKTGSNKDNTNNLIQENIATWYIAIRNIAITILVIVAMYIAIRMLLATTSEKKAQYKEILIYWVQSLALIFVLHYIMIGIIAINDALVKALYKAGEKVVAGKNNDIMETLFVNALKAIKITTSMANTFAYMVLCVVTIMFFISYLKRMMTIAFLITIAPLVTVTYSIDKIGDGKSQALNAWLKEFSYTILIQPFHCITYLALGSIGTQLLTRNDNFADIFIGIYFLSFILQSENIVRGIFGIKPNNLGNVIGEVALISAVAGKMEGKTKGGVQYTGDSSKNRFIGGLERSGGQKRTPIRTAQNQQPPTQQPRRNQPPTNQSPTNQPPTNQPPTNQPPTNQPQTNQPATNQPQTNQPQTSQPQTSQPQTNQPQTNQPPTNQSPTNQPPTNGDDWYDNYSAIDARRETLNNKSSRTPAENRELSGINNKTTQQLKKRRLRRAAVHGYVGSSLGVAAAMAKMAIAVASGDGKAVLAAGFSAKDSITKNMNNAVERASQGDMVDAYKLARKVSPDKDEKYFKDLAKGNISAANEQEQEFVDRLQKHQNIMDKHGKIDDKKLDNHTDTLLDNINSGDLDQHTTAYRAGRWIARRKSE